MKTNYNKKQQQHKAQINIMESKLFELLPYIKIAIESDVMLETIFNLEEADDRITVKDLYKKYLNY